MSNPSVQRAGLVGVVALLAVNVWLVCVPVQREQPVPPVRRPPPLLSTAPLQADSVIPSLPPPASTPDLMSLEYTLTSYWAAPKPFWWRLSISADGAAELRDFPEGKPRLQRGSIGPVQFRLLDDYLTQIGFQSLDAEYNASRLQAFDCGEHTLIATTSRGTKRVYWYDPDAPPALWVLYHALADLKATVSWHDAQ